MSQTEKTFSWIVKGGLLLVPFIPLLVARSMYFPFITGKNFAFRILIEILAVFWVWLMVTSPRFRPKISLLTIAYTAFIGILILATLLGLSPNKSFWSSYERMEGLFGHLHLFLYFLMLGSVFVVQRDWRLFFNTSIVVSAIVTIYGFVQLAGGAVIHQGGTRVDATMGNATYLAVYLLFHLFLIAIFFFKTDKLWLKGAYGALFLMELVVLYYTASRGPLLGLLGGAIIFALLLAFLEKGRIRQVAIGAALLILLIPAAFFFVKDTEFIRSSGTLERFANITGDAAAQGRLTIWNMALRGWQERPILGWGQESFIYIFSKYYEPSLWRNEPWFDRAHNVFLDWLTASGLLGLLAYLSVFGAALFLLLRSFIRGMIDKYAFAGLAGLLAAHFFQNNFVFDNLTSYLLFFAVLAWIHRTALSEAASKPQYAPAKISPAALFLVGLSAVAVGYLLIVFNIKPVLASRSIIRSLVIANQPNPAGKVDSLIGELGRGVGFGTFGTTEIREQANQIGNAILSDVGIAPQDKQKYLVFLVEELEKQRKEQPFDVRAMAFISNVYSAAGRYDEALSAVDEALRISPKRQQFYFVAAEAYLSSNRPDKAIEVLRTAHELDPMYDEAVHNLAIVLIVS
ncbi:MAG: O-antigen ligase family protein, partial [Candidatus Sungiibacteriota bacterium]